MKEKIWNEINFTRKERLAILVLMVAVLIISLQRYLPRDSKEQFSKLKLEERIEPKDQDSTSFVQLDKSKSKTGQYKSSWSNQKKQNTNFENSKKAERFKSKYKKKSFTQKESKRLTFKFDPNTISQDSLELLGFKKWVANNWVKFRSTGKKYHSTKDIYSIYGVDTSLVNQLNEFIEYPNYQKNAQAKDVKPSFVHSVETIKKVDLNNCDKEDLKAVPGIGPVFAGRILKFKEILGGYSEIDQLKNVYGITDSTYQIIKDYMELKTPPSQIMINVADKDVLGQHYMIGYKNAKLIISYRVQHGPFVNAEDFNKLMGLTMEEKQKIIPYLDFQL